MNKYPLDSKSRGCFFCGFPVRKRIPIPNPHGKVKQVKTTSTKPLRVNRIYA